jgi:hypothetical protein
MRSWARSLGHAVAFPLALQLASCDPGEPGAQEADTGSEAAADAHPPPDGGAPTIEAATDAAFEDAVEASKDASFEDSPPADDSPRDGFSTDGSFQDDSPSDANDAGLPDVSIGDAADVRDVGSGEADVADGKSPATCQPGAVVQQPCGLPPGRYSAVSTPIVIDAPTQITMSVMTNRDMLDAYGLRLQCDDPATELMCGSWRSVSTRLLEPGTYYVVSSGGGYVLEPPWPPPTNDNCASPKTLALGSTFLEDRIVSGGNRYYSFTTVKTGLNIAVNYAGNYGSAAFDVYPAGCADASPSLGGLALLYHSDGTPSINYLSSLPPGTYTLVASQLQLGTRYTIDLQSP